MQIDIGEVVIDAVHQHNGRRSSGVGVESRGRKGGGGGGGGKENRTPRSRLFRRYTRLNGLATAFGWQAAHAYANT